MRSITKNRKQGSNLPISIKLVVKIGLVAVGFCVWESGFLWALAGVYLFLPLLRGILSCLLTLVALFAILFILLTFL